MKNINYFCFGKCRKKKYRLEKLFRTEKEIPIHIYQKQWIEAIIIFITNTLFLVGMFFSFDFLGKVWLKDFSGEFLFSVFVIPLLYALKRNINIFNACFVQAYIEEGVLTVKRGFFFLSYDRLYLKELNNIEIYSSFFGKIWGYSQLDFYAFGGMLSLPYVRNDKHNYKIIEDLMNKVEEIQEIK